MLFNLKMDINDQNIGFRSSEEIICLILMNLSIQNRVN